MTGLVNALFRKRPTRAPSARDRREKLGRESLFHLVIGGIGESLPLAVFVVTGQVAGLHGGFLTVIALLTAALAAFVTGLCFTEYKTLEQIQWPISSIFYHISGEGISFVVGWFFILQQSSTFIAFAKTMSSAVDYASGKNIGQFISDLFGTLPVSNEPVDLVAGVLVLFSLTTLVALGWTNSTRCFSYATCIFTASVCLFFIGVGAFYADYENWFAIDKSFSQGFGEVLSGAALCSSVYSNHYLIDTRGRSLWRSRPSLPVAFGICVFFSLLTCVGVALIINMMVHYRVLSSGFALMEVFEIRDVNWARYVMATTTVLCMGIAVLNACQSLCDTVQTMVDDGLLFRCLFDGHKRGWTSVRTALAISPFVTLIAILSSLSILLQLMACGYLIVSVIVCFCVLRRRYRANIDAWSYQPMASSEYSAEDKISRSSSTTQCSSSSYSSKYVNNNNIHSSSGSLSDEDSSDTDVDAVVEEYKEKLRVATLTHLMDGNSTSKEPTVSSSRCVTLSCLAICVFSLPLDLLLTSSDASYHVIASILLVFLVVLVLLISRQPQVNVVRPIFYRVPLIPWTPAIVLCLHLAFLTRLLNHIWIWITVWSIIGLVIYFAYSMHHSTANVFIIDHDNSQEQIQLRPLPPTSVVSSVVQNHWENKENEHRLTQVDTILISA